ncbi:MAG: hypothetical protein DDT18_00181 [Actinobacteria bacterium]|nr:hypothetical protein [Actinomycetota bacterium]
MVQGGFNIGLPHIHSHSFNAFPLTFRKAPIVGIQTLLLPAISNVLYGGGLKVTHQGQVFMPFGRRLLIYPYMGYHSFPLTLQSSLNRTFQDMPGLIPTDPQNIRRPLDVTFLKKIQGQPLKQQGKLGARFGPRHLNLQNPMLRTIYSRNSSVKISQKLATVQMSPNPFLSMIVKAQLTTTLRTRPAYPFFVVNPDVHSLSPDIQINSTDRPRLLNSQQISIKFGVSHGSLLSQWNEPCLYHKSLSMGRYPC